MIRIARAQDAAAIHAIYLPQVLASAVTFETAPPGEAAMRERILGRLDRYPWLVCEQQGELLGYAYASRFRDRAAYDWIAETSVYVREDARRRGVAGRLYAALLQVLALQGVNQAMGAITLPGDASVALHERLGFVPAGRWRRCGYKLGRWWDVGLWQKELQPPQLPPPALVPFAELAGTPALAELLERV